jgi:glycosyltransferase involved in cell wall biosynthesis
MPRYRILFLATRYAIPPDSGYATAVHYSIQQLLQEDVDVRILLADDGKAYSTMYPDHLLAGCVMLSKAKRWFAVGQALLTGRPFVACKWSIPQVVDAAAKLYSKWPFDLIQAEGTFHMANALAIRHRCGAKVVMRAHNVEYIICERMARAQKSMVLRLAWRCEAARLRRTEGKWCRAADLCLPISKEDRLSLQALAPRTPMVMVQVGAVIAGEAGSAAKRLPELHFIHLGNLDWAPRMEGLLWFLRDVWPLARQLIPGVRLSIAGSASDKAKAQLRPWTDQGVEVLGFVQDLDALARTCAAVIVPMRCGGGIKIRVITAWANGWPIVGTRQMGAGLPAQHEVNCLMADDPTALAAALVKVATDQNLRSRLIHAGLEIIRSHFSWEAIGRTLRTAHEAALKNP